MNRNNGFNDRLNFIIVEDNINKIAKIKDILTEIEVEPLIVTGGKYRERTVQAAIEIHGDGKLPVIFLDEYFGTEELDSGSLIYSELSHYLKGKGGLLFPISPFPKLQLEKWSQAFIQGERDWYIEEELNPILENFNSTQIARVCNEFLSMVDSKEQGGEIKNG
ncbi:MAG: hypothetical protein RBT33_03170 [Candidatus Dojkabacteria bacterium]|jgi:hypothetical protein|nr:hypothetical protein [Candidatus Dojkabacteria bacterium]